MARFFYLNLLKTIIFIASHTIICQFSEDASFRYCLPMFFSLLLTSSSKSDSTWWKCSSKDRQKQQYWCDPTVSSSACLSEGNENTNSKLCLHPHVHCSIFFYNSQDMETIKVSIIRWMNKENLVYKYKRDSYSAIKRKEILPFMTCMDLEGFMLSEINHTKTNTVGSHIWNL